ncbi:unnamed protein product [Adineta steineri]|uniref:NHL repeat containing protein n=1 Tax=Adineta steineri TaxID=433720 RepID=A0A814WHW4_9BILA|nr:unnamed protein product [Adineta steineri]CAF1596993.1 unnamed protein product [Adineta steineri]
MNNRVAIEEPVVVNPNRTQLQTLYEHFRKRKLTWIICFIISFVVIIIVIPTIIFTVNKTKREKISIIEITTDITTITAETTTTGEQLLPSVIINSNTKWKQNGSTVAGGHGLGNGLNQLNHPLGIYVDDDNHNLYIADSENQRIVRWKFGANNGEIVAGGNGPGDALNQLRSPTDVILDKEKKYIIVCDRGNSRIMRWSRGNNQYGQILVISIGCFGLAMDNNGDLYISETYKHQIRRWREGDKEGTVVAGGSGQGNQLNQFNEPQYIFVDDYHSVYVADSMNRRVMKWMKNATEDLLVAPVQVSDKNLNSRRYTPVGILVDHIGNIYVSDAQGLQITRWSPDTEKGTVIVNDGEWGNRPPQLMYPQDLSFDRECNLYVVDWFNHRIQKFAIDLD